MSATKIEWCDRTWNPVTGCTKVSPGRDHCYAENIARRFAGSKAFPNGFDVTLHPQRLDAPFRWRKPARVFVNSMSDLFHPDVSDQFIARVFAVMALATQHTFQVLTKRHGRMRSLLTSTTMGELFGRAVQEWISHNGVARVELQWPLPNVWIGVSVEDQQRADLRIPALVDTPAAVRFLSCEPLLGETHLRPAWRALDWVIVGGESGPGARPMDVRWVRILVDDCRALGVAPFVKQLGSVWARDTSIGGRPVSAQDSKGGEIETFPVDLRVREFPVATR